jgi:signal transduction histidine kinase
LQERAYAGRLAEANAALAKAQRERARLSRDLHDGSIQSLYAVGLHLRSARRQVLPAERELGAGLAECQRLVKASILELRDFLLQLKEESGPTRTFREVMDEWVRRLRRISSEEIDLAAGPDSDSLPPRVVIELVQVAREAVSNAMRHAEADRIVVTLGQVKEGSGEWALEIEDDGKGWREEPVSGVGFRSMRERAAEIGGRMEIRSRPWAGTRVRVTFEVDEARSGRQE